jgi:hypothetical protein
MVSEENEFQQLKKNALPQQEKKNACMCIDVTRYILKMVKLYTSPKFIADTFVHMCKQCDFSRFG